MRSNCGTAVPDSASTGAHVCWISDNTLQQLKLILGLMVVVLPPVLPSVFGLSQMEQELHTLAWPSPDSSCRDVEQEDKVS